jgi:hypothetical protein
MTAPAQSPVLKPQQPEAQSASLKHWPVMNCFPAPLPTLADPARLLLTAAEAPFAALAAPAAAVVAGAAAVAGEVATGAPPVNAMAAFAFGVGFPKPHPPSRS